MMDEDIYLKTANDAYVHMMWSSNEPYEEDATGVIGVYVYDETGNEHPLIDGGELDVYDDRELKDNIEDVLDFIDCPTTGYEILSEETFPEIAA